ncbi:phage tail protein [Frankia sp. CNm7]|uniref:Phage tail protein n=1 Tax=Frankia nepalensis TaxID=1836974 RepID=A0A937RHV7_9ACTN|nr:phage tail protein [Frankia nepalensis]MBL7494823.1 phage tail protein [Frankia nepalensis]MBL7508972.1 phage tail protein [Frankia nepalensis]MBL7524802.1 phage tail protein [Frankia nepalensis]MBL7626306.1 phage tail protein [Frankia nepalensis]
MIGLSWAPAVIGNWVPGVRPLDPFPGFNFAVEIEGLMVGGFTSVDGLGGEIRTTEYREGGVNGYVHRLPDCATSTNLVLKHGLTANSSLWNWYDNAARGVIQRCNGTIMMLDRRQIPLMWWNFRNALPVRWTGPALDASSDGIIFESIELAHEGLSKPLASQALAAAHGLAQMARV